MIEFWLDIPFALRLTILAAVGSVLGAFINWAVDRMNWVVRSRSPWSRIPDEFWQNYSKKEKKTRISSQKQWMDYLPVLGWFTYSRYSSVIGPNFWVRPFLVEVFCTFGLAWLYSLEADQQIFSLVSYDLAEESVKTVHFRFLCHGTLFFFLILATLIDFDDYIIPDSITIPGTVIGLFIASFLPEVQLPVREITEIQVMQTGLQLLHRPEAVGLNAASPNPWPELLAPRSGYPAIGIGLGCWWMWCFGMMNRVWRFHVGWKRGLVLFLRRLRRSPSTWHYLLAGLGGSILIMIPWFGGVYWHGTFSGLVGMAFGGGIIWGVRLIGSWLLGREAMGFGDVTFMAMIGAFVGWQPCLFIFFLAPVAGLVLGLIRYIMGGGKEIPYGPFLALATMIVVLFWKKFWFQWGEPVFIEPWLVPALIAFCAVMFVLLLGGLRLIKSRFH
ncbi:MAG: A24 family peptidase [Planctomycetaceae bacterium]|nr:A24 family peptidase [Planctomycetaceae bacterium]